MDDILIYFGSEVKALDDKGRVGGYLVRFTDADHKDLTGEYFTTKSYLGPQDGDGAESIFDHGFPVEPPEADKLDPATLKSIQELADRTFTPLKTKRDAVGIWAETVLNIADDYEKRVFNLVKQKKLGWSSGAPGHRVKKTAEGEITSWPIAEGSLTPRPAEPLNRAIPIKSLAGVKFIALDEGVKKWDETDSSFRYRLKDPADFKPDSFRTITLQKKKPQVQAVIGILKGETSTTLQTLIFSKDDWKMEDAQQWVDDHKDTLQKKSFDSSLAEKLNQLIADRVDDGLSRDSIVKRLAREAAIEVSDVESILTGETPRPADARLKAIARVLDVDFESLREIAHGVSPQTIKGMFETALADRTPSRWELDSAFCDVVQKLANVAASTQITGVEFDLKGKIHEAILEYMTRLENLVIAQINDYVQSGNDDPFYLKAIANLENDLPVSGHLDLDDHSQLVVSALREVTKRFRGNHEARVKTGRVLSEKNRQRIKDRLKEMQAVVNDLQSLLDESQPMASDNEKRAAQTNFLRLQQRISQLGATQ